MMDDRTTDDDRDARPPVAEEAENYQRNLHLPADTARAVAADLNADPKRKPASDEVDNARAAEARATQPN